MDKFKHGGSSGYSYHKCRCEECVAWKRNYEREYYLRNRERIKDQVREYKEANPDKVEKWHAAQRERYAALSPEEKKERNRYWAEYQRQNKEHVNEKNRKWKARNKWRLWFYNWKAAEQKRGQVYAPETLEWVKNLEGSTCTYCGDPVQTIDHVIPRSRGGTNDRDNLVPACHRCNRRKNKVPVEEFLRRMREEY